MSNLDDLKVLTDEIVYVYAALSKELSADDAVDIVQLLIQQDRL